MSIIDHVEVYGTPSEEPILCEICNDDVAIIQTQKQDKRFEFVSMTAEKSNHKHLNVCDTCARNSIKEFLTEAVDDDGNVQVAILPPKGNNVVPPELMEKLKTTGFTPVEQRKDPNPLTEQEMRDLDFTEEEINYHTVKREEVLENCKDVTDVFSSFKNMFEDRFPEEAKEIRDMIDKD